MHCKFQERALSDVLMQDQQVASDLPAGRKVCGFLSHNANKGCTVCFCSFSESFGRSNFSNFNRDLRTPRKAITHRANIRSILQSKSVSEKSKLESEHGCRYSILLELPYFDPVRMLLIDPMHNLFLGTGKEGDPKILVRKTDPFN